MQQCRTKQIIPKNMAYYIILHTPYLKNTYAAQVRLKINCKNVI